MALSTCRRVFVGLVAGMLTRSSAAELCESGTSGKPCSGAQDHLLIQVQRNRMSSTDAPSWRNCSFHHVSPVTPYYWEPNCSMGMLGCWADGMHAECRFCDYEYISCPASVWRPLRDVCDFDNAPRPADVGYFYDEGCVSAGGGLGCNADGQHMGCRLCGGGAYATVRCKVDQCTFANEPATPYYYDDKCKMGMLGCLADGIHVGCRFCGRRPFENVPCPASVAIPAEQCWFRNEPAGVNYTWDRNCTMGKVGCWADGIHAECRFCGGVPPSPYTDACP